MANIGRCEQINREFVPHFEKLRSYLADQDREWLIEQIVRLSWMHTTLRRWIEGTKKRISGRPSSPACTSDQPGAFETENISG
jgi:hypothetical protein